MSNSAKAFEDVKPEEYAANPVWAMAFDASDQPGWNETWRKPVVGVKNLEDKSVGYFIALRVQHTAYPANALFYDRTLFPLSGDGVPNTDWIGEILIWRNEKWLSPIQLADADLTCPIIFEAIPAIRAESRVRFIMNDKAANCASRITEA